jgi:hypothetical protein
MRVRMIAAVEEGIATGGRPSSRAGRRRHSWSRPGVRTGGRGQLTDEYATANPLPALRMQLRISGPTAVNGIIDFLGVVIIW